MKVSKSQATTFNTYSQNFNNSTINNNVPKTVVACNDRSCKYNKAGRCTSYRIEIDSLGNGSTKFLCKTYERLNNRLQ